MIFIPRTLINANRAVGASFISLRWLYGSRSLWLQNIYGEDEQKRILDILNSLDEATASRLKLRGSTLKKVLKYRERRGQYFELNDLVAIGGIDVKGVCSLCEEILFLSAKHPLSSLTSPDSGQEISTLSTSDLEQDVELNTVSNIQTKFSHRSVFGRNLDPSYLQDANTAAAVIIKENFLCWAVLECQDVWRNQILIDWNIFELPPSKLKGADVVTMASRMNSVLPQADLYVLEEGTYAKQSRSKQDASVDPLQCAVGLTLMCAKHNFKPSVENRIYFVKSGMPARIFNFHVGREVVSPQETITQIISGNLENIKFPNCLKCLKEVSVAFDFKETYLAQGNVQKEFMCHSLLLAKAFVEVALKGLRFAQVVR